MAALENMMWIFVVVSLLVQTRLVVPMTTQSVTATEPDGDVADGTTLTVASATEPSTVAGDEGTTNAAVTTAEPATTASQEASTGSEVTTASATTIAADVTTEADDLTTIHDTMTTQTEPVVTVTQSTVTTGSEDLSTTGGPTTQTPAEASTTAQSSDDETTTTKLVEDVTTDNVTAIPAVTAVPQGSSGLSDGAIIAVIAGSILGTLALLAAIYCVTKIVTSSKTAKVSESIPMDNTY